MPPPTPTKTKTAKRLMSDNGELEMIDPMEMGLIVDVLSQLPTDFYKKLEATKWQERKEALDALEELLTIAPKLKDGDYGDLVRALNKIITEDSNNVLVGLAAKCMAMLAKSLKKRFTPYASNCLGPLLQKFKEYKQTVVVPLQDAVDAVNDILNLKNAQGDIALVESENSAVKAETVASRCLPELTRTHQRALQWIVRTNAIITKKACEETLMKNGLYRRLKPTFHRLKDKGFDRKKIAEFYSMTEEEVSYILKNDP